MRKHLSRGELRRMRDERRRAPTTIDEPMTIRKGHPLERKRATILAVSENLPSGGRNALVELKLGKRTITTELPMSQLAPRLPDSNPSNQYQPLAEAPQGHVNARPFGGRGWKNVIQAGQPVAAEVRTLEHKLAHAAKDAARLALECLELQTRPGAIRACDTRRINELAQARDKRLAEVEALKLAIARRDNPEPQPTREEPTSCQHDEHVALWRFVVDRRRAYAQWWQSALARTDEHDHDAHVQAWRIDRNRKATAALRWAQHVKRRREVQEAKLV